MPMAGRTVSADGWRRIKGPATKHWGCHRWLLDTPAKRYAADLLYGDLLARRGLRILDVGGGLTAITRELAARHELTVVDLLAHDDRDVASRFRQSCAPFSLAVADWYDTAFGTPFDVVIAADLFPNVDQRLSLFLERYAKSGAELRMSLTFYEGTPLLHGSPGRMPRNTCV